VYQIYLRPAITSFSEKRSTKSSTTENKDSYRNVFVFRVIGVQKIGDTAESGFFNLKGGFSISIMIEIV